MLFWILGKLKFSNFQALLATIIFVVHPLFINAIAWIPGRNDLLFGMFSLIAFLTFIIYFEKKNILYFVIHVLGVLLAVLSKETALLLPVLLALYFVMFMNFKEQKIELLKFVISWIVIDGIWFLLRSNATLGTQFNETGINALMYNWTTLFEFITKFITPSLSSMSVLPTYDYFNLVFGLIILIIGIVEFFISKNINKKLVVFGFLWFLLLTIPGMLVRRLNSEQWNDYLDCRFYLPAIGLLILAFQLIPKNYWNEKKTLLLGIFTAVVIIFSITNFIHTKNYANPSVFYKNAVEQNPNRAQFQYQYAKACIAKGDNDLAEEALKNAINAQPKYAKNYYNLGVFYAESNPGEAIEYLNKTINLDSNYMNAYSAKIDILLHTNQYQKARTEIINAFMRFDEPKFLVKLIVNDVKQANYSEILKYSELLGQKHQTSELANLLVEHGTDLYESGKTEYVETVWNSAIAIDSTNKFALQNLFQYYLAVKPDYKKAETYYQSMKRNNIEVDSQQEFFLKQKLKVQN
jgi:tetratricopeptide (TPR) repeat protein